MRKLILIFMFLSGVILSQPRTGLGTSGQLDTMIVKQELILDSLNANNDLLRSGNTLTTSGNALLTSGNALTTSSNTKLDAIQTATEVRTSLTNSTLGYGNKSILVTATQLSSSSVACKTITITNNTNGGILYVGSDNSLTTSNGADVLHYREVSVITINNLNKVWLIGSATIDLRYRYEN